MTQGSAGSHIDTERLLPASSPGASAASADLPSLWRDPASKQELRSELNRWMHQALPTGVSILARNLQVVVDLAFLGKLTDEGGGNYLAAASLAFLYTNVTCGWVWKAFGSALNTLCSQAIGAGNEQLQHVWLHIGMLVCVVFLLPIYAAWSVTEQVLLLARFDPALCALAGKFTRYLMLWLLPSNLFVLYSNYLQTQGTLYAVMAVNLVMLGVNALLNWLLIFVGPGSGSGDGGGWGLGFIGSPIATSLTSWGSLFLLLVYVHRPGSRVHHMTLAIYKSEVLNRQRIRAFLAQALPTSLGNLVEDLQFSVMSFIAANIGATAISVHNSTLNLFLAATCLLYGAVKATTVRVGHYVGAGDIRMAKAVGLINFAVMTVIAVIIGTLFITLKHDLGSIFSDDPSFIDLMASISGLLGGGYCALSLFFSAMGVLQGQGRVGVVALAFLIGAWGVTVPLAFVFVKVLDKGLLGVWAALVAGYAVITVLCGIAVFRSDWPAAVARAQERAKRSPESLGATGEVGSAASVADEKEQPLLASSKEGLPLDGSHGQVLPEELLPSPTTGFAEGELVAAVV